MTFFFRSSAIRSLARTLDCFSATIRLVWILRGSAFLSILQRRVCSSATFTKTRFDFPLWGHLYISSLFLPMSHNLHIEAGSRYDSSDFVNLKVVDIYCYSNHACKYPCLWGFTTRKSNMCYIGITIIDHILEGSFTETPFSFLLQMTLRILTQGQLTFFYEE